MKGLSPRAQKLLFLAQEEGKKSGSVELLPEHILLALLKSADGLGYLILQDLRINVLTFQLALEQSIVLKNNSLNKSELPLSRRLKTILDIAVVESRSLRNDYIGTEHILIATIQEENSASCRFFQQEGITLEVLRNQAKNVQEHFHSSSFATGDILGNTLQKLFNGQDCASNQNFFNDKRQNQNNTSFLSNYSRDLTELSREGKLDPVIGRSTEVNRVIQILSRRTKSNPILVGEPGIGKTAIVEGLAQKIASGDVPYNLLKKKVLSLDLIAMIAGTKYRGEFEERMKRMMKEIKEDGNIIIFIDELHSIIGAGGQEGTNDASNILKPALSRGEIQIIGATTTKEYRKYIEKDSALERRFQVVKVFEPDASDSEQILKGLQKKYEDFHGVSYDDDVIPAIIKFSTRYIPERFLPDKAIDILDEAGSAKKFKKNLSPQN